MDELANELGMIDVVDATSNVSHVLPISSSSSTASSTSTIYGPIGDNEIGDNVPNHEEIPASRTRYNLRSTPKTSFASDDVIDSNGSMVTGNKGGTNNCKGTKMVQFDSHADQIIGTATTTTGHSSESIKMTGTEEAAAAKELVPANETCNSSAAFIRKSFVTSAADDGDRCKRSIKSRISSGNGGGGNNTSPDNNPLLFPSLINGTRRAMSAHDINLECGGGGNSSSAAAAVTMDMDTPHLIGNDRNSFDRRSLQLPASKNKNHSRPVARSASILLRSKVLILSDSESEEEEHSQSSRGSESRSKSGQSLRKANKRKSRKKSMAQCQSKGFTPFGGETSYGNLTYPGQTLPQSSTLPVMSGKRKRSTTISFSASGEHGGDGHHHHHHHHSHHGNKMDIDGTNRSGGVDTMDMDGYLSSSLSESSIGTDCEATAYEEADDEQSDFYEVMSRVGGDGADALMDGGRPSRVGVRKYGHHHHHHHRTKPMMVPRNPFAMVSSSTPPPISTSSAAALLLHHPSTSSASTSFASSSTPSTAPTVFWKRRKRNQWQ